mmetsp:Transcript_60901/g.175467  ORF Transcript_60901/g.175467 Transcript_60901/m.175467 type:complete len:377 (+) Transcript_60901:492-1622(+)
MVHREVGEGDKLIHFRGDALLTISARPEDPVDELVELDAAVPIGVSYQHDLPDVLVGPNACVQVPQHPSQLLSVDNAVAVLIEPGELVHDLVFGFGLLLLAAASLRLVEHGAHHRLNLRFVDHSVGIGALARRPLHHVQLQVPDEVRVRIGHLRDRASADLSCQLGDILRIERDLQRTHVVQNASHGPDIGRPCVRLLGDNLWAQVIRSAYKGLREGSGARHYLGDAEVPHPQVAALVEEYVCGLQVPVEDVLAVEVLQRQCCLREPFHHLLLRYRRLALPRPLDLPDEVTAVAVVHDDAQPTSLREVLPIPHDVRMLHLREQPGFAPSLLGLLGARPAHVHELRHVPVTLAILDENRHSERAFTDLLHASVAVLQ